MISRDGSQHLEQTEYDTERTQYLEAQGYRVVRFWNNQVEKEMDGIIQVLDAILNEGKREAS